MTKIRYCESPYIMWKSCSKNWAEPIDTHKALMYDKVQAKNIMRESPVPMGKWEGCSDEPKEKYCRNLINSEKMVCPCCSQGIPSNFRVVRLKGVSKVEEV